MNDEEQEIMARHAARWRPWIEWGQMVIFGPVLDSTGSWGPGVVEDDDEEELRHSPQTIRWSRQAQAPSKSGRCWVVLCGRGQACQQLRDQLGQRQIDPLCAAPPCRKHSNFGAQNGGSVRGLHPYFGRSE